MHQKSIFYSLLVTLTATAARSNFAPTLPISSNQPPKATGIGKNSTNLSTLPYSIIGNVLTRAEESK